MSNGTPQTRLVAVPLFLILLAWIIVPLRCVVRVKMLRFFTADDWTMVLTLLFFTAMTSFNLVGALKYGWGRQKAFLTEAEIVGSYKMWKLWQLSCCMTSLACKTSISFLLLRLAPSRAHRFAIYATLSLCVVGALYFFFTSLFQCLPVAYYWEKHIHSYGVPKGKCIRMDLFAAAVMFNSAVAAATDWIFAGLPIWMIWGINMRRRQKIQVAFVLGLGALASCATMVRFRYVKRLAASKDMIYVLTENVVWSTLEPGIGIFAACIASMRPLLRLMQQKFGFSSDDTGDRSPGRKDGSPGGHFPPAQLRSFPFGSQRLEDLGTETGISMHSVHLPRIAEVSVLDAEKSGSESSTETAKGDQRTS